MKAAQQITRKSNLRTSKASWSPASVAVSGDPLAEKCAAEGAARCCCSVAPRVLRREPVAAWSRTKLESQRQRKVNWSERRTGKGSSGKKN